MIRLGRPAALLFATVVVSGLVGTDGVGLTRYPGQAQDIEFVPASPELLAKCRATARKVGYLVPCPTQVPAGLTTGAMGPTGCALDIVGPGGVGGCHRSWRGWIVGSSYAGDQHLVIHGSPNPVRSYAKLVNGPAWYPHARVRPLAWATINGWRMRAVYAPRATNDGSAFQNHVVLIWTVRGHTYGVGFHNIDGIRQTLFLDKKLARGIELVGP